MTGQPQEEWVVELKYVQDAFQAVKADGINSFKARRINKDAEKLYKKYPDNISVIEMYAISFGLINQKEKTLQIFEELLLPLLNPSIKLLYIDFYIKYAGILYFNKKYKEALEIILNVEKYPEKAELFVFYTLSMQIYFENHLYKEIILNYNEKRSKANNFLVRDVIYFMFADYYFGQREKVKECLDIICKSNNSEKLDSSNIDEIFQFIIRNLVDGTFKTEPTDLENEFLENIRKIAELYVSNNLEEISFEEKLNFKGKEFNLHIEKCEEGGFYGEIPEIDGCYTQGETLGELRDNIREVLEMYSEEELTTA